MCTIGFCILLGDLECLGVILGFLVGVKDLLELGFDLELSLDLDFDVFRGIGGFDNFEKSWVFWASSIFLRILDPYT